MRRPSRRKLTIGAIGVTGAGAALAVALAGPNVAFAQDATPSPSASASSTQSQHGNGGPDQADRARHQDELATALAKELGIDKSKVVAALAKMDAARPKPTDAKPSDTDRKAELKTRLDAAVKAGTISQADEDSILKAADAGVLMPGHGPGGHRGGGMHGDGDRAKHQDEFATALAKELGIDKDKVVSALTKIESERPTDAKATDAKPNDADRKAELKSRLDAAVKAGTITQADEDSILKAADAGVLMPGPQGAGR